MRSIANQQPQFVRDVQLSYLVEALRPLGVLASGGIGDGAAMARALKLGAQGVHLGTRFEGPRPHIRSRVRFIAAPDWRTASPLGGGARSSCQGGQPRYTVSWTAPLVGACGLSAAVVLEQAV